MDVSLVQHRWTGRDADSLNGQAPSRLAVQEAVGPSFVPGAFRDSPETRQEFFSAIGLRPDRRTD